MSRRKEAEKIETPMSAMIDVVFLLLIFFIVTQKDQLIEAHMAINLPSPSSAPSEEKPQLLEIHVLKAASQDQAEYLLMGNKRVTIDVMEETLASIASYDKEQTVIIKVDPNAREAWLIDVLDRCTKVGLSKLNVLTLR